MKVDILGVKVDDINMTEVLFVVEKWIWNPGKQYIVTPNPEIILAAQKDSQFKRILNSADLAIPDSSSLGFSYWFLKRNILLRLLLWPLFLLPIKLVIPFDRVSGTDLMEALCKLAAEKGFTTGFLGGKGKVAKKTAECLQKKYPGLKVVFAESGGGVNDDGRWQIEDSILKIENRKIDNPSSIINFQTTTLHNLSSTVKIPPTDILFVAFGHIKQEKWIAKNLQSAPVHVMMGVGGAFDYLSGNIPRAPEWVQDLGFEWLYRLIMQPWRIKRQLFLLQYLWLLIKG